MKMCCDCKWYKPFGAESTDQCLHEKAESRIGGIRTEFTVTHRTCEVMLAARCEGHKLFEAASEQPKIAKKRIYELPFQSEY